METVELMDVYAMDYGIRRLVARMTHEELNPLCNKRYKSFNFSLLTPHLNDTGTVETMRENILAHHKRITDWQSYKHHLECLEDMLVEYEDTTNKTHSHDAILFCLQRRVEADLNFPKEKLSYEEYRKTYHPRWTLLGNYLASQINRRFSGYVRELGAEPDSHSFLIDKTYERAAKSLGYCYI